MSYQIISFPKLFSVILFAIASGCATTEKAANFIPPVYPSPPDQPRFIFERTLLYNDDVEEISSTEQFKRFATGASRKVKGLIKPYDVAVKEGRVYVTDTVQRAVVLFDIPGKRYKKIGTDEPGLLTKPLGIDISNDNKLYVCDIGEQRILVYDLEGKYLYAIGDSSNLRKPTDVSISHDGNSILVVDNGGIDSTQHRIAIFDARTKRLIKTIGTRGNNNVEFNLPLQLTVDKSGNIYIVDAGNFRVQALSSKGDFLFSFGSVGRLPGQFARPKGIATDPDGNIYVVDTAFGNFQIFNPKGELLMAVGKRGSAGQPGTYMLPAGIDVDDDGKIYFVDQFFRKVDVFKPYHQTQK